MAREKDYLDEFDAIFGDTYIGKNPTPLKSSYRILFFEFSGINTITGIIKDRYDLNRDFDEDDFITLIYSMGFITIKNEIVGGLYEFEIPNYVIKMLYFNYFAIEIERRNSFKIKGSSI
jgi:hypothetical protein